MKIKQILFLVIGFFMQGCNKVEHVYLKSNEFKKVYKNRKILPILVDTRSIEEYRKGHIEFAVNFPRSELFLLDNLNQIRDSQKAQKHKNWVLFLYAKDDNETKHLKSKIEELCNEKFIFNAPSLIYYLEGGYEALEKS